MNSEAGLDIELGDIAGFSCPCCGRDSETVHGFLYDRDGETAVYFAGYTHGHPQRRANMVLSVDGWGEGKGPENRRAIPLEVTFKGDDVDVSFPAPNASPWYGEEFLGAMVDPGRLDRQELEQFRKLAIVAIEKDPRVAGYRQNG
jgi:hypothetical protein